MGIEEEDEDEVEEVEEFSPVTRPDEFVELVTAEGTGSEGLLTPTREKPPSLLPTKENSPPKVDA